jgi:hypothetical protein
MQVELSVFFDNAISQVVNETVGNVVRRPHSSDILAANEQNYRDNKQHEGIQESHLHQKCLFNQFEPLNWFLFASLVLVLGFEDHR